MAARRQLVTSLTTGAARAADQAAMLAAMSANQIGEPARQHARGVAPWVHDEEQDAEHDERKWVLCKGGEKVEVHRYPVSLGNVRAGEDGGRLFCGAAY